MTVREAMEQSRRGPIPGHRPKPKRKMPKPNIPEILGEGEFSGHEGLEKARFLDHLKSENDVLPRDPRTGSSQNQQKIQILDRPGQRNSDRLVLGLGGPWIPGFAL